MADLEEIGDRSLGDLPGNLFMSIRDHLDTNEQNSGWRLFVAALSDDYDQENFDALERESSPTTALLNLLKARGMTIRMFVHYAMKYADASQDYSLLNLFNIFIPVEITQQPLEEMHVLEGERVTLTVKARGIPPPRFQWYKGIDKLEGATSGIFCFLAESDSDSGDYCCLVYNNNDPALLRLTRPVTIRVLPAPELEIKEHPRSCAITVGGNALFKCEVWGDYDVQYQWFLDNNMLHDEPNVVQGSNTSELRLYNVTHAQWVGCYSCRVSREPSQDAVMSKGAVLQIINLPGQETKYTATDKVALLIGNYDYRSANPLAAPKYDVQTLSNIFQSLGFKVVSLLNLTKAEMIASVHEFGKLVGVGVYCVFYFCGHGFEVASQCYLVPTDAPVLYNYKPCVSADSIFKSLLQQEPQICCMILDICRKSQNEQTKPVTSERVVVEKGNAIWCYGTSYGLAAYERKQYGILVSHLKNILSQRCDIETVFKNLREAISKDPLVNHESRYKQIPEIRTNLLEVHRSFADPIVYRGHTEAFNVRQLLWDNAHRKPDPIELVFPFSDFTVTVKLDFQQEFSNVLKIYTLVLDPGPTQSCTAFVSAIPVDVAEKAKILTISESKNSRFSKNYVVINNIQRLKSPMKISVTVMCKGPTEEKTLTIALGLPLVAQLQLWKERPDLDSKRRAEEVDESQEVQNFTADFQDLNCR
ncbi:unnamed protein product [Candidula unifasciata]|uniref:Mucosa-associated lymphoid tissue lymphoma translocation protein 1 n=1 Tax=Candidula unifasciata TaxID=100452 RepID=A0A8S3YR65_9EUPU|nr:unnamed protein product [Candidula unifasciata]